jgi:hypothetical protein
MLYTRGKKLLTIFSKNNIGKKASKNLDWENINNIITITLIYFENLTPCCNKYRNVRHRKKANELDSTYNPVYLGNP